LSTLLEVFNAAAAATVAFGSTFFRPGEMLTSDQIKRAETGLRIAQFKFRQGLKKDERSFPAIGSDPSVQFCSDLNAVFQQNTPANIQVPI
jgi:hypothetical protein